MQQVQSKVVSEWLAILPIPKVNVQVGRLALWTGVVRLLLQTAHAGADRVLSAFLPFGYSLFLQSEAYTLSY